MVTKFDNINDLQSKFVGTICLYDKKAVNIKSADVDPDCGAFRLGVVPLGGRTRMIQVDDPAFSYKDYTIGYANMGSRAIWWYRIPHKQYRQGLRRDQLGYKMSQLDDEGMGHPDNFQFSKAICDMLENVYPDPKACQELLLAGAKKVAAFHPNFALSWDALHEDHILEYRGRKVGVSLNKKLSDFKLMDKFTHLRESLGEALFG